ncbi:MAG: hypothetical protein GF320_14245 [Armatimonadia bacterium]|nr:hypothetical protein [Armatimonadia bacterium]
MKQNPKMAGSNLIDCVPQSGMCPVACRDCFYNRPGWYAGEEREPVVPNAREAEAKIVRINSGHDSNIEKMHVLEVAARYPHHFYNTSIPDVRFFDAPVVVTINRDEETDPCLPEQVRGELARIMYVRFRLSPSNLGRAADAVRAWAGQHSIPVVLTYMAYYTHEPPILTEGERFGLEHDGLSGDPYIWKVRTANEYWCASSSFIASTHRLLERGAPGLVLTCGTSTSSLCRDCGNCELLYYRTVLQIGERYRRPPSTSARGDG